MPPDNDLPTGSFERFHKDNIFSNLPLYSVFYIDTHGDVDDFGDCYCPYEGINNDNGCFVERDDSQTDSTGKSVYHRDITHAVAAKNNQPPYNLVFIDACETAGVTDQTISYDQANAFKIAGNDRCFLGWHNEVYNSSSQNIGWKIRFWNNLSHCDSVYVAIVRADIDGDAIGEIVRGQPASKAVSPIPFGDIKTTLHGIYGGKVYGDGNINWHRPL